MNEICKNSKIVVIISNSFNFTVYNKLVRGVMSFISFSFAAFFFITVISYRTATRLGERAANAQKILLLVASLVFYAFADLCFLPFLAYAISISYLGGLACKSRISLAAFILADLAPLLAIKYVPQAAGVCWLFPLGISFFTFQSAGYIADVYKKKVEPEKSLLNVALFVSFFPVISSGPIQRAGSLIPQLNSAHSFSYDDSADGLRLFAWGLFKKLVIADRIALYVNYVYGNVGERYGLALLLATLLYSFQIYCDFSGYSDMAIGVARYLGFDVGKNFNHPYLSQSVGEFWRRWHISLSSWLRDYVYIPLGGSRVALPRIYLNLILTFLASGIWHGSTWNFVIWGALHGMFLCAERATKGAREKMQIPAWLNVAITFCLVTFAWIFFRTKDVSEAALVIRKIAATPTEIIPFVNLVKSDGLKEALHVMLSMVGEAGGATKGMAQTLCLLAIFVAAQIATKNESGLSFIKKKKAFFRWAIYILCLLALLYTLPLKLSLQEQNSYSTNFIYQNF